MKHQTKKRFLNRIWKYTSLVVLLIGSMTYAHAQFTSGSVTGVVADETGAVVPDAAVTATSLETNTSRSVSTNSAGYFTIPSLQPGGYKLTVTHKGFEVSSSTVTLNLNQVLNFNFSLKVGESSQTVEVNASESGLETQSHEVGNVIDQKTVENLPASTGQVFSTLVSATNVQPFDGGTQLGDILTYGEGANSLTIGGAAYGTSSYLQDGVTNFNMFTKTANFQPSTEATQEVSLIQNGANVRFDEPSVVNVTTKAGTNHFHGRLYDYLQNEDLNAIGPYLAPKTPLRYNQFGGNIGGPIFRNKLFFFFDYAGLRKHQTSTIYAIVPTAQERMGDFSADSFTIYNPSTYDPVAGTIQPFNNNKITTLNSFATQFLNYIPLPTPGGTPIPGINYQTQAQSTSSYDEYIGRIDYHIRDNDLIYGAYETTNPNSVSPTFATTRIFDAEQPLGATNAYVQEVHNFSPAIVNIARFGYNGSTVLSTIEGSGKENYVQEFGIQNLNPTQDQWAPPSVVFGQHSGIGNPYAPQGSNQKLFEFADEVDWSHGKHNIFFGGELDKLFFDGNWVVFQNGYFAFNGQFTTDHKSVPSGGSDLADFLLGYPAQALGSQGTTVGHFRQWNVFPYIQDDWRITKKLTLNLGLRYDYYQSPQDALGLANVYDLPTNTNHKGTFEQNYTNFAPRVGFAYAVNDRMVIHGGYGLYYAPFMYSELLYTLANPPNWALQSNSYALGNPTPISNAFSPTPPVVAPWTVNLKMPTPRVQQFNVAIQQSFGKDWTLTLAYLGSTFAHSHLRYNPNQAVLPTDPSDPNDLNNIQGRRPYQYVGDVDGAANIGYGNYNAGQIELERRYSNGFSLLTSYVWSKAMDIASGDNETPVNGLNPSSSYGLSDYNLPHVFKLSPLYRLPFHIGEAGKGWLNREVIEGWQASGIFSVESGNPFSVGAVDYSYTGAYHLQLANQTCDPNQNAPHTLLHWFNTSCLTQPALGTFGNEQRNNIMGPRRTNLDLSLMKDFGVIKSSSLQFRADFFNALNHPLWYIGVLTQSVASPTYGQATATGSRVIQLSMKLSF